MYLAFIPLIAGCGGALLVGAVAGIVGIVGVVTGSKTGDELTKNKGEGESK
jgi:hypothetical protein